MPAALLLMIGTAGQDDRPKKAPHLVQRQGFSSFFYRCLMLSVALFSPQVVFVSIGHRAPDFVTRIQTAGIVDKYVTVDFRCVEEAAAHGALLVDFVDQYFDFLADAQLQTRRADRLLVRHETVPTVLLDVIRHHGQVQQVGRSAFHRRVLEAADAVQLGFGQPVEQVLEVFFGFAREADDEGRTDDQVRADLAPVLDARQGLVFEGRAFHGLEHFRAGVLERDVQVRQDLAGGHQRDQLVHVRIRVHVMQAHPHAQAAEGFAQFGHAGFHRRAVPEAGAVFHVDAVGAGVLGDHQQLFHAGFDQALGFVQHVTHRAADQLAAHRRDDAEAATVVAAFGNLQVRVVARGQLDALRRHQVDQRVVVLARRHHLMHGVDHLLVLLRAGHGQHARVYLADIAFFDTHAAGDDDLAVFLDGLADHFQGLCLGRVDEAAGVDHHHVRVLVSGHDVITFHAQLRQDAFGVDQSLWAAQGNKADLGVGFCDGGGHV